mmetsp:Transcript_7715/g.14549  ORF Transcript_7715/g.14549 Transcript_7715/m.14549 type:complete len:328 (+) Transcript_7715:1090-2073(+)
MFTSSTSDSEASGTIALETADDCHGPAMKSSIDLFLTLPSATTFMLFIIPLDISDPEELLASSNAAAVTPTAFQSPTAINLLILAFVLASVSIISSPSLDMFNLPVFMDDMVLASSAVLKSPAIAATAAQSPAETAASNLSMIIPSSFSLSEYRELKPLAIDRLLTAAGITAPVTVSNCVARDIPAFPTSMVSALSLFSMLLTPLLPPDIPISTASSTCKPDESSLDNTPRRLLMDRSSSARLRLNINRPIIAAKTKAPTAIPAIPPSLKTPRSPSSVFPGLSTKTDPADTYLTSLTSCLSMEFKNKFPLIEFRIEDCILSLTDVSS